MSQPPDAWHEMPGADTGASAEELKRRRWQALSGEPPRRKGFDPFWPLITLAIAAIGVAAWLMAMA